MKSNTDLALELAQAMNETTLEGVEVTHRTGENATITSIVVKNSIGEKTLGKPIGTYVTIEITPFTSDAELFDGRMDAVGQELKALLPTHGLVLVAGLGNEKITPDALGPKTLDYILATRHITEELEQEIALGALRDVATIVPGVLGQTGMETGEVLRGLVDVIHPVAMIVIDALASKSTHRLGCTVQLSDSGIVPGSGVGNHRFEISQKTMGVPVIAMGIPTVVDGATLALSLVAQEEAQAFSDLIEPRGAQMIVTPREIDTVIERGAKLLGMSINICMQPEMDAKDLFSLVG